VVTYTWLGQAFLALLPWVADPEVGMSIRTGGVGYDRLRPLDTYSYWYARTLGWIVARPCRAHPECSWRRASSCRSSDWRPGPGSRPPGAEAALLFVPAFLLMVMLAVAVLMLANVVVAASLNERGSMPS